ncbi:PspC domain-containing protein [Candidatus Hodarchaeum mangrovi]
MSIYCSECGSVVRKEDIFCNASGSKLDKLKTAKFTTTPSYSKSTSTYQHQPRKRLYRSVNDRWIAGVCGGLGTYFNIDPILIRIGFIIISILGYGMGLIIYIVLALLVEEES